MSCQYCDINPFKEACGVISYTSKCCHFSPYHPKYDAIEDVPIVKASTAYIHPETGFKYILIITQALYVRTSKLPH
jgi:hypothetical protein